MKTSENSNYTNDYLYNVIDNSEEWIPHLLSLFLRLLLRGCLRSVLALRQRCIAIG